MTKKMIQGISSIKMFTYLQGCRSRAGSSLLLSGGSILPYISHSAALRCCLGNLHRAGQTSLARSTEPFRYMCTSRLQRQKDRKVR